MKHYLFLLGLVAPSFSMYAGTDVIELDPKNFQKEVIKSRLSEFEQKRLLQVEQVRDAIKLRLAKAEAVVAKNRSSQR